MDITPGTIIDNRYTVESTLGRGGMAQVYLVRHRQLNSLHALKVLTVSGAGIRDRLVREGRVQGTLQHPNVVSVTDLVDIDGTPGLVMEYVRGPTLQQLLRLCRPNLQQVDRLARGILKGVSAAHAHGLVHRDLKPANILLTNLNGEVVPKISDFGLVKVMATEVHQEHQTRTGAVLGTPAYMAPEQVRDSSQVDARSDIFSLGTLLYELVTGNKPFRGGDRLEVFQRICDASYVPVREEVPTVPDRMVEALEGALQSEMTQRVPTVDALINLWTGGTSVDNQDISLGEDLSWGDDVAELFSEATPASSDQAEKQTISGSLFDSAPLEEAVLNSDPETSVPAPGRGLRSVPRLVGFLVLVAVGAMAYFYTQEETLNSPGSDVATQGGTLKVAWRGDWGSFGVDKDTVDVSTISLNMTLEPLTRRSDAGQFEPWVIEQAEVAEDGKAFKLVLRSDVSFHAHPCLKDGLARKATSEDVVTSIELQNRYLSNLSVIGLDEYRRKEAEHISGIRIEDNGDVSVSLKQASPYPIQPFQSILLVPIEIEECKIPPPGTGPFYFTGPLVGNKITVHRAEDYWGPPANLDAIELIAVSDEVGTLVRMGQGEIDLMGVSRSTIFEDPGAEMPVLASRFSQLDVSVAPWVRANETVPAILSFTVNVDGQWSNSLLRSALGFSLDREVLMADYPASMVPTGRFLEPRLLGSDPAFQGFRYDPDHARELLARAGYPDGKGLSPLRLGAKSDRYKVAEGIVQQAQRVGLPIILTTINDQGLATILREHSLDAVIVEFYEPLIGNDPYFMMMDQISATGESHLFRDGTAQSDQSLYSLFEQVAAATDRDRRAALYAEIEAHWFANPPYLPLGYRSQNGGSVMILSRPEVKGVADPVAGRVDASDWSDLWPSLWLQDSVEAPFEGFD